MARHLRVRAPGDKGERVRLSEYFGLEEFAQHGEDVSHIPLSIIPNIRRLHDSVLYPLRCGLMVPISITSGYRSPAYNRKIGGARNSQHCLGTAADIKAKGFSAAELHAEILRRYRAGLLPGLRGLGLYPTFVHVDARVSSRLHRWTGTRR